MIVVEYGSDTQGATLVLCFSANDTEEISLDGVAGQVMLDSSANEWGGPSRTPPLVRGGQSHCSRSQRRVVGPRA